MPFIQARIKLVQKYKNEDATLIKEMKAGLKYNGKNHVLDRLFLEEEIGKRVLKNRSRSKINKKCRKCQQRG